MKKKMVFSVCMTMATFAFAASASSNDKYLEAMIRSISEVYQASDVSALQHAVNTLERIGAAETNRWEPQYYTAFGYLMMTTRESDAAKKDTYLDRAMVAIEKAKVLAPEESEIIALEGFVYMMRVTVDPGTRGPEFTPRAMTTFAKATALNPENPRALALTARMMYGSAQFFGTSTGEACQLVEKSLAKFNDHKPGNPLAPTWGKPMAESLQQQCQ